MFEKLKKIRQENPKFNEQIVDMFAEIMPDLLNIMIDGFKYDCHIASKDVAKLAESYITNNKGEHIGFKWKYEDVVDMAKNYVNLDETEFYPADLYVWANVKYGDMSHITKDPNTIIEYAISELSDDDFPFYPASQRAYQWVKRHVEIGESKKQLY